MKYLAIVCISLFVSPLSLAQTLNCTTYVVGNTTHKTCYDGKGNAYKSTTRSIGGTQITKGSGVNFGLLQPVNPAATARQGYEQARKLRKAEENQERAFGIQERQIRLQEQQLRLQEQQLKMAQQQRELDAIEQENATAVLVFQHDLAERMKDEDFRREFEKAIKAMKTGKEN